MLTAVENNDTKWEYTYDIRGNILTKKEYTISTADDGTKTYTLKENGASTFGYDTVWADKLTSFNGQTITYDEVGNPLTYRGNTLTWNFGRRLASFGNISYTYNEDGIRTKKIIGNKTTEFYLDGSNIIRQSDGTDTLYFFYDRDDNLTGFEYNGDVYFYVKNMQGDVVAISDDSGNVVAEYTYDPWGKVLSVTGTNSALGNLNPFRYRGYYYDTDTSLYYLQSRYYDPETGRFLNSDDVNFIGTTESEISYNPFAYCENDPVNAIDPTGNYWYYTYAGFKKTRLGFDVNVSRSFLSKWFCLAYAYDFLRANGKWNWYGYTYSGMTKLRIAQELWAHAIAYYVGSYVKKVLTIVGLSWRLIDYVIEHTYEINVNSNDNRAWAFRTLWWYSSSIKYALWRYTTIPFWLYRLICV